MMAQKKLPKDKRASVPADSNIAIKEQLDSLHKVKNSLKKKLSSELKVRDSLKKLASEQSESLNKITKPLEEELDSEQLGSLDEVTNSLEKNLSLEQLDKITNSLRKSFNSEQLGSLNEATISLEKNLSPEQLGSLNRFMNSPKKKFSSPGDEIKKELSFLGDESDSRTKEPKSEKMLKPDGVRKVSRSPIQNCQLTLTSGITPP